MTIPAGAARFSGFAHCMPPARPCRPEYAILRAAALCRRYWGGTHAGLVIDLGCGAGLSTESPGAVIAAGSLG